MSELREGAILGPISIGPLAIQELVQWSKVAGDGNPLHFDHEAATAQGFPGVLVSGAFKMALIYRMLEETAGLGWQVKRLRCRNTDIDLPPCTLTMEGCVEHAEDGGAPFRRVEVKMANDTGKVTVMAWAELVPRPVEPPA